ncbi:MAG TPA: universal stress protein [Solirubrobacterales bacterium]|nr:universal stress protein [Solirubrobacterales bacterium]
MFKSILIALDGSDTAKQAIPIALELAKADKARVVIAHVEERMATKARAPLHTDEDQIQAELEILVEDLEDQGIEATIELGDVMAGGSGVAHAIADIAQKSNADLIVAGTRGHSPIEGLLVGSVTIRLLHIAKQPVLVVPASG